MDHLEHLAGAMDRIFGDVPAVPADFGNGNVADEAQRARMDWMRRCRKVADERKAIVMKALAPDAISVRLMLTLYVEAERDHAKAEFVAEGK